jgi:hypothetical protein
LCVVLAVAWAAAIGFSRIFLGHHWLTDVILAWLLGLGLARPVDHRAPDLPCYPSARQATQHGGMKTPSLRRVIATPWGRHAGLCELVIRSVEGPAVTV